jgi:hypothetical protein
MLQVTEVTKIAENVSIEKRNEVQSVLNSVFDGVLKMREQLENVVVENENDKKNMKLANTIRLGVRQVRLEAEKIFDAKRAEVQQQMLSYKTEDQLWLKAKQTMQILTKEIEEQARWKEETKQRFEAEQKELKVKERILKIQIIAPEINRSEYENMSDENFKLFYEGLEKKHQEKIEAEKKASEEKLAKDKAEAEERERIRIENERLKAEAAAKEKQLAEERAKAEAQRKELEEKVKREKQAAEAKIKAEREEKAKLEAELKEKAEAEEKLKKEQEAKLAAELKAKKEAERKAKAAPDKIKLELLAAKIDELSNYPIDLKSQEAIHILEDVKILLNRVSKHIREKNSKL